MGNDHTSRKSYWTAQLWLSIVILDQVWSTVDLVDGQVSGVALDRRTRQLDPRCPARLIDLPGVNQGRQEQGNVWGKKMRFCIIVPTAFSTSHLIRFWLRVYPVKGENMEKFRLSSASPIMCFPLSVHCSQRFTGSRIVTNQFGHFVPIALIGLGKLLHRLCAFDFFKGNIALQNSLQDLPFFQSYMQRLAKAWYRKGRRMLCKYQTLWSKVH